MMEGLSKLNVLKNQIYLWLQKFLDKYVALEISKIRIMSFKDKVWYIKNYHKATMVICSILLFLIFLTLYLLIINPPQRPRLIVAYRGINMTNDQWNSLERIWSDALITNRRRQRVTIEGYNDVPGVASHPTIGHEDLVHTGNFLPMFAFDKRINSKNVDLVVVNGIVFNELAQKGLLADLRVLLPNQRYDDVFYCGIHGNVGQYAYGLVLGASPLFLSNNMNDDIILCMLNKTQRKSNSIRAIRAVFW